MNRFGLVAAIFLASWTPCAVSVAMGQEKPSEQLPKDRFEQFSSLLSGAKLSGHFTVSGREKGEPTGEEYHILDVRKMDEGDYWMFKARIKYGDRDVTVPMPLEVKWAGNTPVITLDDVEIPLVGKFSARVVFDGNKYAGTWSHGEVGGHMFGEVLPNKAEPKASGDSKQ